MFQDHSAHLVEDTETLLEHFVPSELLGRQQQTRQLEQTLAPATHRAKPNHCRLFGPSGSGKTAAARWLLRRLQQTSSVQGLYVNCWRYPTYFSVLDLIVRELRVLGAERLTVSFRLKRLSRHLGNTPFVVVLDEVDQLAPRERHSLLYNLSQLGNVGLVTICNAEASYCDLEDRVKSRLNPVRVDFAPYDELGMLSILRQRAHQALAANGWSDSVLQTIAQLADGDARLAIKTLHEASVLAEARRDPALTVQHVEAAWQAAKDVHRSHRLAKLTDYHRLLCDLVSKSPCVLSGDLWRLYLGTCRTRSIRPISVRTFSQYCNHLTEVGAVRAKRAAIQGKVRQFSVTQ